MLLLVRLTSYTLLQTVVQDCSIMKYLTGTDLNSIFEFPAKWNKCIPAKWNKCIPAKWNKCIPAKWNKCIPAKWNKCIPAKWNDVFQLNGTMCSS